MNTEELDLCDMEHETGPCDGKGHWRSMGSKCCHECAAYQMAAYGIDAWPISMEAFEIWEKSLAAHTHLSVKRQGELFMDYLDTR